MADSAELSPEVLALRDAYDEQLRGEAEVSTFADWDRAGPLWRARRGDHAFISYESLAGYDLEALVAATVAYFAETGATSAEWKTRGHDDLPELDTVLRRHGFEPEDLETVMVGEATALAVDVPLREGLRVVRLDAEPDPAAALAEATTVQGEVFGFTFDLAELVARRGDRCQIWGARDDADGGRLVCVGRLELAPGTDFAGLWGGGTLAAWRGLGVYRAVTAARAEATLAAGHRLMNSDCTPMSQPILERSGLHAVTTTTPYAWRRP